MKKQTIALAVFLVLLVVAAGYETAKITTFASPTITKVKIETPTVNPTNLALLEKLKQTTAASTPGTPETVNLIAIPSETAPADSTPVKLTVPEFNTPSTPTAQGIVEIQIDGSGASSGNQVSSTSPTAQVMTGPQPTVTPLPLIPVTTTPLPTLALDASGFAMNITGNINALDKNVTVHSMANEQSQSVGFIKDGTLVGIEARSLDGRFLLITYKDSQDSSGIIEGFVPRLFVENNVELTQLPFTIKGNVYQPATNVFLEVKSDGGIIHTTPMKDSPVSATVRNTNLPLLLWTETTKDHRKWYFVRTDTGIEGWIFKDGNNLLTEKEKIPYLDVLNS